MTSRRQDGQSVPAVMVLARRLATAATLLAVLPSCRLAAQVGHDPSRSPFRDITTKQSVSLLAGNFFGNRALAGVGAQSGPMFGVRLRTTLSGPIDLMVSSAYVRSKRNVIDAAKPESTRVSGPVDYNLIVSDIAIGLSLTGGKTWHGLAPYLAFGVGFVTPTRTVIDPGGYKAGSGFTFAPTLGVRARVSRALMLQFEARDHTIRYEWPLRYFAPIDVNGNALPPILSSTTRNKQLTHNFSLTAGLSYNFNF